VYLLFRAWRISASSASRVFVILTEPGKAFCLPKSRTRTFSTTKVAKTKAVSDDVEQQSAEEPAEKVGSRTRQRPRPERRRRSYFSSGSSTESEWFKRRARRRQSGTKEETKAASVGDTRVDR
jgi:hypothetical protein